MAQFQQLQFAETIRAMKRAVKRRADDSDDDSYIHAHTNRGHKLQRDARRVQRDRLGEADALAYRKKIEHAGYQRSIIALNPPYIDDEGDVYSNASSDRDDLEPLEENPFADVKIEALLRPLTAPSELEHHPTLSLPYCSTALTQMAEEAEEMLRRERANLWRAKRVLQRFRGDADWAPCGMFDAEEGEAWLNGDPAAEDFASVVASVTTGPILAEDGDVESIVEDAVQQDAEMAESDAGEDQTALKGVEDDTTSRLENGAIADEPPQDDNTDMVDRADYATRATSPSLAHLASISEREATAVSDTGSNSNGTNTHAMTTRARARSPAEAVEDLGSPSPSDSMSVPPAVHPWFQAPQTSLTDRDLALPGPEAEEARKLLLLYVQKQEQIVRSLETLGFGLQKADRLRTSVFRACKAEGHVISDGKGGTVTEMSDGEDWFDLADWGMHARDLKDGTLEKGKDEVEDPFEEEGRKVRGRRRVNRM